MSPEAIRRGGGWSLDKVLAVSGNRHLTVSLAVRSEETSLGDIR